jgi:hypothetical protein
MRVSVGPSYRRLSPRSTEDRRWRLVHGVKARDIRPHWNAGSVLLLDTTSEETVGTDPLRWGMMEEDGLIEGGRWWPPLLGTWPRWRSHRHGRALPRPPRTPMWAGELVGAQPILQLVPLQNERGKCLEKVKGLTCGFALSMRVTYNCWFSDAPNNYRVLN